MGSPFNKTSRPRSLHAREEKVRQERRRKKKPAAKIGPIRLPAIPEDQLTPEQRSLMSAIASGPRGTFKMSGPFFCYLHSPGFGELAQKLGAYCRFGTSIAPRLTEFAILTTAQFWKAQYEWAAHEPQALKAGVKPATIQASARRARADIGAEGRARDLCLHQGALCHAPRRAIAPTRPRMRCSAMPAWSSWSACSATTPWWR